jgi:hypothetical protein
MRVVYFADFCPRRYKQITTIRASRNIIYFDYEFRAMIAYSRSRLVLVLAGCSTVLRGIYYEQAVITSYCNSSTVRKQRCAARMARGSSLIRAPHNKTRNSVAV